MKLKLANFCYAASDQCPPFIHKEPLENISARWLAPETMLRHDFSKETDVWAFGVLVSFSISDANNEQNYRDEILLQKCIGFRHFRRDSM